MSEQSRTHSDEPPTRKRPRTDSESSAASVGSDSSKEPFSRDGRFWYEDGNIVVIAGNVGFRVYKGLLSAHSDVFRDMFSLPQPGPDPVGDCPVVHVTDTAAELRSLLSVLLPTQFLPEHRFSTFEDLANCTRLAHKYGMKQLLEDSLKGLEYYFPSTLASWDRRNKLAIDTQAIVGVNVARLTNTLSLLPAALYLCCQLTAEELIEGHPHSDNTEDTLSPEDLRLCLNKRAELCTLFMTSTLRDTFSPIGEDGECSTNSRCNNSIHSILSAHVTLTCSGYSNALYSSFKSLRNYFYKATPKPAYPLCSSCIKILVEREGNRRKQIWAELPKLFGLETDEKEREE
ncbi:uncharacterized protein C8Q71DRAFT_727995 [Rhodofomes roseus]|uniref:BTB domain-containing protein n=1 Tax=Rhodofomes roseus TaxID=34475 RepID=A0ABQ8JZ39_9APHY|nr:uncharacterized protein C8Q71DRAFT_727995 [Rhodofomes roseus]KAH9829562.1 hypothetical protein C8Q71DRAFT_727995 [Rhodofomes roseus]